MVAGNWFITPHAVLRYAQRIRPKRLVKEQVRGEPTYERCLGELIRFLLEHPPRLVKQYETETGRGTWLYRTRKVEGVRLRLLVADGEGEKLQIISVLKG